jgi:endonuclease G
MNKLEIEPVTIAAPQDLTDEADALRSGFDRAFLPFTVGARTFTSTRRKDLARLNDEIAIPYCHFTVWLSKSRRYPLCVAWNIDASRFVRLNRKSFRTDRRGDLENHQLTDRLYVNNPLDKGHIARRADLCWGSKTEAELGNFDSFFFSNIAPQHQSFNQSGNTDIDPEGGVWGRLENTIFDSEAPHDLKVSLMGGPVFCRTDPVFEQNGETCRIPKAFWKVVAFTDDADGQEKVFGFYLTQAEAIEGLVPEGIDLSEWVWARITLADLEEKTGVRFETAMFEREVPFVAPQGLSDGVRLKPLLSRAEYFR